MFLDFKPSDLVLERRVCKGRLGDAQGDEVTSEEATNLIADIQSASRHLYQHAAVEQPQINVQSMMLIFILD